MDKVLLVEDSEESRLVVSRALANSNISLFVAESKKSSLELIKDNGANFDLVVIDIVLPDGTGFEVFEALQKKGMKKDTPVFFLTSSGDLETKLLAFNLGADDYLVKPISPVELRARIEAKLKKTKNSTADVLVKGNLRVELSLLKSFYMNGDQKTEFALTATEFKILAFLMQNENSVFSQEQVIDAVWGSGVHILSKTVVSHVYGLRKKLGPFSTYIENIPNVGYRFKVSDAKREPA